MPAWTIGAASAAAQLGLATVFLWAGLSKLRTAGALGDTIERLGIRFGAARVIARLVIVAELVAGAGLLVAAGAWWPRMLVAVLGAAFAGAGLLAVATRKRLTCQCFGNVGAGRLGWRQVQLLPLWIGLAALATWQPPTWSVPDGLALLAFVLLGLSIMRMPPYLRTVRRLQGDRIALAPTYRGRPDENEMSEVIEA